MRHAVRVLVDNMSGMSFWQFAEENMIDIRLILFQSPAQTVYRF
jgi:hypothetical protein